MQLVPATLRVVVHLRYDLQLQEEATPLTQVTLRLITQSMDTLGAAVTKASDKEGQRAVETLYFQKKTDGWKREKAFSGLRVYSTAQMVMYLESLVWSTVSYIASIWTPARPCKGLRREII